MVSIIEGFQPNNNAYFLEKAEKAKPVLQSTFLVRQIPMDGKSPICGKGDRLRYDFGDHQVGYITIKLASRGSYPDAPAFLKLKMAERLVEFHEDTDTYDGWLSRGWIQEEWIHIDEFPVEIRLPRRYAFRYIEIEVLATSAKYQLVVENVQCEAVSSVSDRPIVYLQTGDELLDRIDRVGIRTLHNCMQEVYEDGPKRDRRLWIGDLRLQALTNYKTFKDVTLVKRCLYLFAGSTFPDGRVSANIFTSKIPTADDTYFFDYALFFVATLADYVEASGDRETLDDLYMTAKRQIEIGLARVGEDGLVKQYMEGDSENMYCFLDWNTNVVKQAGAHGVLIYCMRKMITLAELKKDTQTMAELWNSLKKLLQSAREKLYDDTLGVFVSGEERQISTISQIWMILAGVFDTEKNRSILEKIKSYGLPFKLLSPYAHHHYVEALLQCEQKDEALAYIREYWGGMVKAGADTFWEIFDPEDADATPYGGSAVNSYCHAWSCTPSYLLREYYHFS